MVFWKYGVCMFGRLPDYGNGWFWLDSSFYLRWQKSLPYRTKLFIWINVREIRKKLNPLTPSSSGAISLKTTLEKCIMVKRVNADQDLNLWTPVYKTGYKSDALSLSSMPKKFIAKHLAREYRERTTPSRIFMPCNLSSCRVNAVIVPSCNAGSKILEQLRK